MQRLLVLAMLALSVGAHATSAFQYATSIRNTSDDVSVRFLVNTENPELGRAWVEVTDQYEDPLLHDDKTSRTDYSDVTVPGLGYNAVTREITYKKSNGESIVCATDVRHSFFEGLTSTSTGKCALKVKKEISSRDDGFYIRPAARAVVSLNP